MKSLILASASPRRAELLKQIGIGFETKAVDIDETPHFGEAPNDYVIRLAIAKAKAAKAFYPARETYALGSDTAVIINGEILGKPNNKAHALAMLRKLSGTTHTVLTSVALVGQHQVCVVSQSKLTFAEITEHELEWYWATGESLGKAGAYAIQGKAAMFISRLEGSYSGVMGLPLYETAQLLKEHGFIIS